MTKKKKKDKIVLKSSFWSLLACMGGDGWRGQEGDFPPERWLRNAEESGAS